MSLAYFHCHITNSVSKVKLFKTLPNNSPGGTIRQERVGTLGQVKFPKFLNTPPQNLQMVDLVWASAKKFDFNPSNQPRIGLQHFMWLNLQYKTKKLTRPNFKIPFDYNLLFLVVVHENIVCPTTFIAKTWKFMGTSVY